MATEQKPQKLKKLVLDSGPIIKGGCMRLANSAEEFFTVQDVIEEIRDSKARHYLDTLPFELKTRHPSSEALRFVSEFARRTGDLRALSRVDLRVLALAYMLEVEANGAAHLRAAPLRQGTRVASTAKQGHDVAGVATPSSGPPDIAGGDPPQASHSGDGADEVEVDEISEDDSDEEEEEEDSEEDEAAPCGEAGAGAGPGAANSGAGEGGGAGEEGQFDDGEGEEQEEGVGQFDDAEEEEGGAAAAAAAVKAVTFSDAGLPAPGAADQPPPPPPGEGGGGEEEEEFPALGSGGGGTRPPAAAPALAWGKAAAGLRAAAAAEEGGGGGAAWAAASKLRRREEVLAAAPPPAELRGEETGAAFFAAGAGAPAAAAAGGAGAASSAAARSRILGGGFGGGGAVTALEEGDGAGGWITPDNLHGHLMAGGGLTAARGAPVRPPPLTTAAGCATTDFAMQNVLVQIGLPLLSVDGMVVRRVKQWVLRCHACFKLTHDMTRLFCPTCGGPTLQKVSVSLDARTGRARLHLRKKGRRPPAQAGARYSLPAPGKAGRFQGELLLREDQLKMGIWQQKANRTKKNVSSAFGEDITQNFGMNVNKAPDIVVGFGRRNPNQMKGRERRGKKKNARK